MYKPELRFTNGHHGVSLHPTIALPSADGYADWQQAAQADGHAATYASLADVPTARLVELVQPMLLEALQPVSSMVTEMNVAAHRIISPLLTDESQINVTLLLIKRLCDLLSMRCWQDLIAGFLSEISLGDQLKEELERHDIHVEAIDLRASRDKLTAVLLELLKHEPLITLCAGALFSGVEVTHRRAEATRTIIESYGRTVISLLCAPLGDGADMGMLPSQLVSFVASIATLYAEAAALSGDYKQLVKSKSGVAPTPIRAEQYKQLMSHMIVLYSSQLPMDSLHEFLDYACTEYKASEEDIQASIASCLERMDVQENLRTVLQASSKQLGALLASGQLSNSPPQLLAHRIAQCYDGPFDHFAASVNDALKCGAIRDSVAGADGPADASVAAGVKSKAGRHRQQPSMPKRTGGDMGLPGLRGMFAAKPACSQSNGGSQVPELVGSSASGPGTGGGHGIN